MILRWRENGKNKEVVSAQKFAFSLKHDGFYLDEIRSGAINGCFCDRFELFRVLLIAFPGFLC